MSERQRHAIHVAESLRAERELRERQRRKAKWYVLIAVTTFITYAVTYMDLVRSCV